MPEIKYTIYKLQDDPSAPGGSVGITFPTTPSLTYTEVCNLIDQLNAIARNMLKRN